MTQQRALEILKSGANVCLTGEPGAGKTYTINMFTEYLRENNISYAVTATTGIAATHINGVTIHSWTQLGIKDKLSPQDLDKILGNSYVADRIKYTRVLIIDEISMLDANTFENIERIISYVRNDIFSKESGPFGGMQVVFVGDFFQLPPVSRNGNAKFAFESPLWKKIDLKYCYLHEQHRQQDLPFIEILTAMRKGTLTLNHKKILSKKNKKEEPKTLLFTHNANVDQINQSHLDAIKSETVVFNMLSSGNTYLVSMLKKNCLSPETLELKVGAEVMFTRNNFEEGYVNGTIGTVTEFGTNNNFPIIQLRDGREICVRTAEWSVERSDAKISQFPLRLAWAITVHKSQGMSLDAAVVDLSQAFEYGQGYVAISRVRSLAGLFLEGANERAFEMHPRVIKQDKEFRALSDKNE